MESALNQSVRITRFFFVDRHTILDHWHSTSFQIIFVLNYNQRLRSYIKEVLLHKTTYEGDSKLRDKLEDVIDISQAVTWEHNEQLELHLVQEIA